MSTTSSDIFRGLSDSISFQTLIKRPARAAVASAAAAAAAVSTVSAIFRILARLSLLQFPSSTFIFRFEHAASMALRRQPNKQASSITAPKAPIKAYSPPARASKDLQHRRYPPKVRTPREQSATISHSITAERISSISSSFSFGRFLYRVRRAGEAVQISGSALILREEKSGNDTFALHGHGVFWFPGRHSG